MAQTIKVNFKTPDNATLYAELDEINERYFSADMCIKALATMQTAPTPPRQSAVTVALQKLAETNTAQLLPVDAMILAAATKQTIGEMQPSEVAAAVNQNFRFIAIDVGYKMPSDDAEWQYIVVRLSDVLKKHFYDLTIEDVKTAFELLTVGDLDWYLPTNSNGEPDRSHYQNFNAEYLCKVLRAYKKRRDVAYGNILKSQPKPQKALPPTPTKTPAEKTRECYDTYKATGKLEFKIPPDDVTIANFLTEKGLMQPVEVTDNDKDLAYATYKIECDLGWHNDYAAKWILRAGKDAREIQPKAYKLALSRCIKQCFDEIVSREKQKKDGATK